MKKDPLLTTLLDLDNELAGKIDLIIGGGYGLYLKQLHLGEHRPALQDAGQRGVG